MIEMDVVLKVFVNKFIEIYQNNSNMLKYGVKVVNLFHKKLVYYMYFKIKMYYKSIKAKLKGKSKSKKQNKISNQLKKILKRKKNESKK